ncbi:16S rRNA (guanine(527)-N(7))-methyltransferase RsmG [Neisseria sp. CCUG12390]|uniref:16S rRNA (guanine(527)-N(7))-methyltransferase RsmG n=1 Tax=Neisseria sp. CCUG12390 TaxID=3392035 RepID=UPI003A103389
MNHAQQLQAGIAEMGLDITAAQQAKLLEYVNLLKKWNKTYNLTALRDESLMISHHLLDSLTLLPYLDGAQTMLDVGSGGGQPGIPAAICRPDLQITLLDANTKKTSFLQQAVIELGLSNVRIVSGRVEAVQDFQADVITSRAFAELADFVNWTAQLLKDGGYWAAMKGVYPQEEIDRLPDFVQVEKVEELYVPQLDAERHMVVLRKK